VEPVVEIWGFRKENSIFWQMSAILKIKKIAKILCMCQNHIFQVAKMQKLVPDKKEEKQWNL
jgi:hypothetical protein